MAAARIFGGSTPWTVLNTVGATTATFDIPVPTDSAMGFEYKITLKETTTKLGGYITGIGCIQNVAGIVALSVAVPSALTALNSTLATATAVFTANSTNLRLTVTGIVLLTIDWQIEVKQYIN